MKRFTIVEMNWHEGKETPYTEEEKIAYWKENEGKETSLDDNYCECETYIVGNHRCSCGNRRIDCHVGEYYRWYSDKRYYLYIEKEPY
jgi:hypothetical protein